MQTKTQFKLQSDYKPAGDQPLAIEKLVKGYKDGKRDQVLLGVTGSGKTFTMANVIKELGKPALILSHNKTLAAQLYGEFKEFFPDHAVEYFVSYYDYYQPEAYIAKTDTYIEKDSSINERIDRMRHSATRSLIEREDVIIISSVSCIYGMGSPETYGDMVIAINKGDNIPREQFIKDLINLQYIRNDIDFVRGNFRVRGDIIDLFPSHSENRAWRIEFFGDEIDKIQEFDYLTGEKFAKLEKLTIFPNSHYVTPRPTMNQASKHIKAELKQRVAEFDSLGKNLESHKIAQRTQFDLEMIEATGTCKGIENYSRYLTGRGAGQPPPTLFEYFPKDSILFVDESHVTISQIGAMYNGDRARKTNLVEHGFRLPSAMDNRPLKFEEWDKFRPQTIHVSATPNKWELEQSNGVAAEQLIRPTGLLDPICEVKPVDNQVDDLLSEIKQAVKGKNRILVTTLTKKMAESLTEYLSDNGVKVSYLHSDVDTLDRIEIIRQLRLGEFDVLVGINLLREGLDIPECSLVAILDADKEGFLRSKTSLVQTIGRAARHPEGRVILYANKMTDSLEYAMSETARRREIQLEHNKLHGIVPQRMNKKVAEIISSEETELEKEARLNNKKPEKIIEELRKEMLNAASNLEFELATKLRDKIKKLEDQQVKYG